MNEQNQSTGLTKLVDEANDLVAVFKSLEAVVAYVKTSIYAKNFEKNDPATGTVIIDPSDIVTNMILGHKAGLDMMESLVLGKSLNLNSYGAICLGKDLGLKYHQAITKIFVLETSNGITYALSVDIYTKLCNDFHVKRKIIKDYEPVYAYYVVTKENPKGTVALEKDEAFDENGKLKPNLLWMNTMTTKDTVEAHERKCEALDLPVVKVIRREIDRETSIHFVREDIDFDEIVTYSIQDAIDAGLYPGITRRGEVLTVTNKKTGEITPAGKDNWTKMPRAMLYSRDMTKGTKMCVPERTVNTMGYGEALDTFSDTIDEETKINITNAMNQSAEEATVITND